MSFPFYRFLINTSEKLQYGQQNAAYRHKNNTTIAAFQHEVITIQGISPFQIQTFRRDRPGAYRHTVETCYPQ